MQCCNNVKEWIYEALKNKFGVMSQCSNFGIRWLCKTNAFRTNHATKCRQIRTNPRTFMFTRTKSQRPAAFGHLRDGPRDAKDCLAHGAHLTNGNRQQKLSRLTESNGRGPNAKKIGVRNLLGHPVYGRLLNSEALTDVCDLAVLGRHPVSEVFYRQNR